MFGFRKLQISQVYFKVMWIVALLLYILIPLKSAALGILYRGIVLLSYGCFILLDIFAIAKNKSIWNNKSMLYFLLLLLSIAGSLVFGEGTVSFDNQIMGILGFIEMPLSIILIDHVQYSEKNTRFVLIINILIAIVFSALSVSRYAYSGKLDSLYLGYSNPNITAIYLLLNQAILIMFLPTIKKKSLKNLVAGLCIYEEYLIFLTHSRICVFINILIIVYYYFGKQVKLPKWIIPVGMLIPFAFLFVYPQMYANRLFINVKILGKEIYSGRETFFAEQLKMLSKNLAFGNVRENYFVNMHNGVLAILSGCGVLGYTFHFAFYHYRIQKYFENAHKMTQYVALLAILGVFLHASAEAALLVSGAHYSIIVATFFWILKGAPWDK